MTKVTRPDQIPSAAPGAASVPLYSGGGGGSTSIPLLIGGNVRNLVIPPGGFAGFAQQTAATQALFQRAGRKGGQRSAAKRRKSKTKTKAVRRVKRKTPRKSAKRLVKGSAAAKAYMAKIRRKRKR